MNRRIKIRIYKARPVLAVAFTILSSWLIQQWVKANRDYWTPQIMSEWRFVPPPRELAPMPMLCDNGPTPRWTIDGVTVERGPSPDGPYYSETVARGVLKVRNEVKEINLASLREDAPEHVYSIPPSRFYSVADDYRYRVPYPVACTVPQVQVVQPIPMFVPMHTNQHQRRAFVNTRGIAESPLTGGLLRLR